MNKNRLSNESVIEYQKLFAIGGLAGKQSLSSLEQLKGQDGKWKETKSMNEKKQTLLLRFVIIASMQ